MFLSFDQDDNEANVLEVEEHDESGACDMGEKSSLI